MILVFFAAACLRLNPMSLLEPDSADYLVMAEAIATTGAYRATYDPSGRPFTWRPPGLSAMLAPVALARGPDAVSCKSLITLFLSLSLLTAFRMSARLADARPALVVLLLAATNPHTLLWGTEVVSEPPFLAGSLVVLWLLGFPGRRPLVRTALAGVTLGAMLFFRTVGVSLVLASAAFLALQGHWKRLPLLLAAATAPYAAWLTFRAPHGQENYLTFALDVLRRDGPTHLIGQFVMSVPCNLRLLMSQLVPGGLSGVPAYSPLTRYPATWPAGLGWLAALVGAGLLMLCLVGMWECREGVGGLTALYVALYLACLACWPSRHERLLWPLLVPTLVFLPAGFRALEQALSRRAAGPAPGARRVAVGLAVLLAAWQGAVSAGMVATNLGWVLRRDGAGDGDVPTHFADWRKAGRWLRAHTARHERVITADTELFSTSRRFQRSMLTGPSELAAKVRGLTARYLAVPAGPFGSNLPSSVLYGDWVYTHRVVYQSDGVFLIEIRPNRSGTIPPRRPDRRLLVADATAAIRREPWRTDLRLARALLLEIAGSRDAAVDDYRHLCSVGRSDYWVLALLAWDAMERRQFAQALRYVECASVQPQAEMVADEVGALSRYAREALRGELPPDVDVRIQIARAWRAAREHRPEEAEARFDAVAREYPGSAVVAFARGEFRQRTGRRELARADFERALEAGVTAAGTKLELLVWEESISRGAVTRFAVAGRAFEADPSSPRCHLRLAELLVRDGVPGRALDVLERAVARFGHDRALLLTLAGLYCDFSEPDSAEPLYRSVLAGQGQNADARAGLARCRLLLEAPVGS